MFEATDPQALPVPSDQPAIIDLVTRDLQARNAVGIKKYGVPLQSYNGRRALVDAYQEALDLCMYLRQEIEERETNSPPVVAAGSPQKLYQQFTAAREALLQAGVCEACGYHSPGRACHCENDE